MVASKSAFPLRSCPEPLDSPSLPVLSAPSSSQFETTLSPCRSVSGHGARTTECGPRLRNRTACASPFPAALADTPQFDEKKTALSPAVATLTSGVSLNPFVCHSYKKHRGVGHLNRRSLRATQPAQALLPTGIAATGFPLMGLLHNSLYAPGGGV